MLLVFVVLAAAVAAGPLWAGWHRKRDASRLQCLLEGHDWGRVFDALDNPQWPTRRCKRCGEQDVFTRCVCGKLVNRQTHEVIDQEPE